jgi:prepilin-type N-terminal cleavage/methylation domain-containing protein
MALSAASRNKQIPISYFQLLPDPAVATSPLMKKTARRNGFTLVELLVVIIIIAALAALAFTAVTQVRKTANQAVTSGNLRQIGVALVNYNSDNGRFPSLSGDPVWDRAIISNLGFSGKLVGTGSIKISEAPALESAARIFTTPEDKAKRDPKVYPRSFAMVPWTTNWSNGTAFRGWKDRPYNKGVPYTVLTAPETSAMVVQRYSGDAGIANLLGHENHAYHDIGGPVNALGSEQQVLFADGHVEKIKASMTTDVFVAKYWPGTIGNTN